MDPASLIHESPFPAPNASSYNLADIWQFPIDGAGVGGDSGGIVGIQSGSRRSIFGQILGHSEPSSGISRNVAIEEPNAVEQSKRNGGRKRRDSASEDESAKLVSTSSGNAMNDRNEKRLKVRGSSDENWELKTEVEASSGNDNKLAEQSAQPSEAPKQDYIHVRARRGQATDSHSLAERARREKISERMRILQDLVPGCNKVIGKASVLDEIINYIQSLQRQVEFLSMKLEAVNSRMSPTIEGFPAKDESRSRKMTGHREQSMPAGSAAKAEIGVVVVGRRRHQRKKLPEEERDGRKSLQRVGNSVEEFFLFLSWLPL